MPDTQSCDPCHSFLRREVNVKEDTDDKHFPRFSHHDDRASLHAAVNLQCVLCSLTWEGGEILALDFDAEPSGITVVIIPCGQEGVVKVSFTTRISGSSSRGLRLGLCDARRSCHLIIVSPANDLAEDGDSHESTNCLSANSDSPEALAHLKTWYEDCRINHSSVRLI